MAITFSDLIQIYRKVEFVSGSTEVAYCIETEEELGLLKIVAHEDAYDDSAIQVISHDESELEVGLDVKLDIERPRFSIVRLVDNVAGLVISDQNGQEHHPFYIKELKCSSEDTPQPDVISSYNHVKQLISHLKELAAYCDNSSSKLIFFSKKTVEISLSISNVDEYIETLKSMSSEQHEALDKLCQWLNEEKTSSHVDEKTSVLAFALSDLLSSNHIEKDCLDINDIINHIEAINETVHGQYALYLENFNYEKFIKKLEDNTSKFIDRINDTLNKVSTQILALPIAMALVTTMRIGQKSWLAYIALIIYCIICAVALFNQGRVLTYLKKEIDNFESKEKIPNALKKQWDDDKEEIDTQLKGQKRLSCVLWITILLGALFSIGELMFAFDFLQVVCSEALTKK